METEAPRPTLKPAPRRREWGGGGPETPRRETLTAITKIPQEMSAIAEVPQEMLSAMDELPAKALLAVPSVVPPAKAGKDPRKMPAEQPSQQVPWGSCLIHNWQEERATNHLDAVPEHEPAPEAFIHQHSRQGLLVHQLFSCPTSSMTMKDIYCPLHRALLPGRGQREAMLESMLYEKYRKEMLQQICPRQMPMESVSTTHQDYSAEDCQFMPLPTSQPPHNYLTEQPCSFWLEQAHSLPGVTSIGSRDNPFRRNAAFSTPITEYLDQPLPCAPLSSWFQPHKQ